MDQKVTVMTTAAAVERIILIDERLKEIEKLASDLQRERVAASMPLFDLVKSGDSIYLHEGYLIQLKGTLGTSSDRAVWADQYNPVSITKAEGIA